MARGLLCTAAMQITLPVDPSLSSPAPEKLPASTSKHESGSSFEDFLGSGKQAATPKAPAEKCAAKPAAAKDAPKEPETPEEDHKDVDPNTAANLAALSVNFPIPLPPPPTVTATAGTTPEPPVIQSAAAAISETPTAAGTPVPIGPSDPASPVAQTPATAVAAAPVATPDDSKDQTKTDDKSDSETAEPTISTALSVPRADHGTPAAMDRAAMSTALLNHQAKAKAAGLAVGEKPPVFATPLRPATPAHQSAPVAKQSAAPAIELATSSDAQPAPTAAEFSPAGTPNVPATVADNATAATTKAERIAQDASVTLGRVERMTEHLQATGRRQMEVEVKLQDDSKVTISLQMQRGELRTTFKTDSAGLRDALQQNWGQVADKNSDRSIRLTPPVFESSEGRNGMGGDARQQPRDRAFADAETESQPFAIRLPAKPAVTTTKTPSQSGLALYA